MGKKIHGLFLWGGFPDPMSENAKRDGGENENEIFRETLCMK